MNFAFVIGGQRCGTTSLFEYLKAHPQIAVPRRKELHYFDAMYANGIDWFLKWWIEEDRQSDKLLLEGSPDYLYHYYGADRCYETLKELGEENTAKFIALLRCPVERAVSHYWHEIGQGCEDTVFETALELEEERLCGITLEMLKSPSFYSHNYHHYSYKRRGYYAEQLTRWVNIFSPNQFLIIDSESLFERPQDVLLSVEKFLGILPHTLPSYRPWNTRIRDGEITEETLKMFAEHFQEHNKTLFKIMDRKFDWR